MVKIIIAKTHNNYNTTVKYNIETPRLVHLKRPPLWMSVGRVTNNNRLNYKRNKLLNRQDRSTALL